MSDELAKYFYLYYSSYSDNCIRDSIQETFKDALVELKLNDYRTYNDDNFRHIIRFGVKAIDSLPLDGLIMEFAYNCPDQSTHDTLCTTLDGLYDPITSTKAAIEYKKWLKNEFMPPFNELYTFPFLLPRFYLLKIDKEYNLKVHETCLSGYYGGDRNYQNLLQKCIQTNYKQENYIEINSLRSQIQDVYNLLYTV